jgi:hypothetical protein
MIALWPLGYTALERQDDELDAAASAAPQLGTRKRVRLWLQHPPSVLRTFCKQCGGWYDWSLTPCDIARRTAFNTWLYWHGEEWIDANYAELCAVLDSLEARIREEVRGC